jgi:hypothetical protein
VRSVAVLLVAAVAVATGSAAASRPSLRLVDMHPVVLAGSGFKSLERVRLTVRTEDKRFVRLLRAKDSGAFRASFPTVVHDPCTGALSAVALGADGSRAVLKLILRVCPPA